MGTAIKHPVPDRVKPVWHRMLYSCTHMATVGFKGSAAAATRSVSVQILLLLLPLLHEVVH